MLISLRAIRWSRFKSWLLNLNDPRWGRDPDSQGNGQNPVEPREDKGPKDQRPGEGPPDLDQVWRDFNKKLNDFFQGKRPNPNNPNNAGGPPPTPFKAPRFGVGLIAGVVVAGWAASGFFIVQEGEQAVVTQFGRYSATYGAGFNYRLPYPIQKHEVVKVTQIRSMDIGRDVKVKATGLPESAMLTQDENIVEIKFSVLYRLNDARAFLFETVKPEKAVEQAAETAVREVVGSMKMDAVLSEERDRIAPRVRDLMQKILDRYSVGIEVIGINMSQGGVRPPERVQAAFDDVLKAGQERERAKNEAQAYANDVIPRAVGAASRLQEESNAYKSRIIAQAEGDAMRFKSVLTEYQRAPQVTRDRMYLDAMQQVYSNVSKVLVESRQGSNLLYLPLDKLMQATSTPAQTDASATDSAAVASPTPGSALPTPDARAREAARSREREVR
jgi:membrane protease subunit HflK